ncbi:PD-(D/E)XK nuclease superfamily protein [Alkalithermobacter thermoalcaliphilus JW-YL-7 = DSM 7308]|uniref:PD-(D/E)XK nuclease superfamily protein n=1 Tax=Alkalithermobacter thermoalcaliphilus JW-YL-7 = DSM 7308 TaxID=1121328 RepID=A0A150FPE2_CLOPD|nr:hypothetical protein JWYL7_0578 [[Clostridium] paradoxum JW-YL-7 = DSM 7308]SHK49265.1 PD-(D/E)XK nuclease superfamily protein [[Clostridium] paradoxum JW-YL-7 = DSM 7308]
MIDIRNSNNFYYSQASLSTFLKCPLKFKIKYIDKIHWRDDKLDDISESVEIGKDFHLICERYFKKIPLGIQKGSIFDLWISNIQRFIKVNDKDTYLPEYEIRINNEGIRLLAKYDLIVIREDGKIEIYDWKTQKKKLEKFELENSIQTVVYMYLLKKMSKKVLGQDISEKDITMIYWQPTHTEVIKIDYSEEKYKAHEKYIENIIKTIQNYDFETELSIKDNSNECRYCEFKCFCENSQEI